MPRALSPNRTTSPRCGHDVYPLVFCIDSPELTGLWRSFWSTIGSWLPRQLLREAFVCILRCCLPRPGSSLTSAFIRIWIPSEFEPNRLYATQVFPDWAGFFVGNARVHQLAGAHTVTIYLKVGSSYEWSVRVISQLRFMIIESLVVLPITIVFLMLMAISSKLYSPAESWGLKVSAGCHFLLLRSRLILLFFVGFVDLIRLFRIRTGIRRSPASICSCRASFPLRVSSSIEWSLLGSKQLRHQLWDIGHRIWLAISNGSGTQVKPAAGVSIRFHLLSDGFPVVDFGLIHRVC